MIRSAVPDPRPRLTRPLAEAIDFLGAFRELGNVYGGLFASDGNYWETVGGGTGAGGAFWTAFYWISTIWFNRMQRYSARFCYCSNGYGATAVNDLTVLALGEGFNYTDDDGNPYEELDDWMEENNWHERSIEYFKIWLIDGEIFLRTIGQGPSSKVRWIDPDLIYSEGSNNQDYYGGLLFSEEDSENPEAFKVWSSPYDQRKGTPEDVSAKEIQHRANKHWGQKRGFSWMMPVLSDIFQADALSGNLNATAEMLAKVAVVRQHEAPPGAIEMFQAQVNSQAGTWGPPIGQNGTPPIASWFSSEYIPRKAIIDSNKSTAYTALPIADWAQFGEVLDLGLRKISSHFFLPMGIFSNDKSQRDSYGAELASGSWIVRCIKRLQDQWKRQDVRLLRRLGFDVKLKNANAPEIAVPDIKGKQQEEQFLIENQVFSRRTVCEAHDGDWETESKQILKEQELFRTIAEPESEAGSDAKKPSA